MTNEIKCDVSKSTKVIIRAKEATTNLDEPLYAINWFSTKIEWLYHLYNFLAVRSVRKIGGNAFFKGKITQTILDEHNSSRSLILIVRYPSGQNFKALFGSTYFKLVSIFRILSVKDFTFGFTKKERLDKTGQLSDNLKYAVHYFKAKNINDVFFTKFETVSGDKIKIKYAGKMIAQLFSQQGDQPERQVPNLMDGIVIFEAASEAVFSEMFNSPKYQSLIQEMESSYIGLIKRTL